MPTFSAALLAGGLSTRMGRDKALLKLPDSDLLLWQRQWELLEEFRPKEMLWSGPPREGIPFCARIVEDSVKGAGPLAGVSACLDAMRTDLLIALAVDLPRMESTVLFNFLARCTRTCGAVGQHGNFFEPLAAIYPKCVQPLAAEHLAQGRYALQDFLHEAVKREMMAVVSLDEETMTFFKNVNSPADW